VQEREKLLIDEKIEFKLAFQKCKSIAAEHVIIKHKNVKGDNQFELLALKPMKVNDKVID